MTDISFYHLQREPLERVLPKLVEKALQRDMRVVVVAPSSERVDALNTALWTYDPDSFLPHGSASDGHVADQPVFLTDHQENPNRADLLVVVDGAAGVEVESYRRCLDLFDGNQAEAVEAAQERWQKMKAAGHILTYWQQSAQGGWERKA